MCLLRKCVYHCGCVVPIDIVHLRDVEAKCMRQGRDPDEPCEAFRIDPESETDPTRLPRMCEPCETKWRLRMLNRIASELAWSRSQARTAKEVLAAESAANGIETNWDSLEAWYDESDGWIDYQNFEIMLSHRLHGLQCAIRGLPGTATGGGGDVVGARLETVPRNLQSGRHGYWYSLKDVPYIPARTGPSSSREATSSPSESGSASSG